VTPQVRVLRGAPDDLELAALVAGIVAGRAQASAGPSAAARRAAPSEDAPATGDEATHPALVDYATLLRTLADPATHPRIVETLDAGAFDDAPDEAIPDDGVAFRVGLFLDGVETLVARAVDDPTASDGAASVPDRD